MEAPLIGQNGERSFKLPSSLLPPPIRPWVRGSVSLSMVRLVFLSRAPLSLRSGSLFTAAGKPPGRVGPRRRAGGLTEGAVGPRPVGREACQAGATPLRWWGSGRRRGSGGTRKEETQGNDLSGCPLMGASSACCRRGKTATDRPFPLPAARFTACLPASRPAGLLTHLHACSLVRPDSFRAVPTTNDQQGQGCPRNGNSEGQRTHAQLQIRLTTSRTRTDHPKDYPKDHPKDFPGHRLSERTADCSSDSARWTLMQWVSRRCVPSY